MRDLFKYFLTLAVMGTGFYAAQQYRRTERPPTSDAVASPQETAESVPTDFQRPTEAGPPSALPVAALADVDRVPLLGPDRASALGKSAENRANSVTKQPTLRGDKPTADAKAADNDKDKDKTSIAAHAGRNDKKQSEAKPASRKQDKKKPATSQPPAAGEDDELPEFAREYRPHFQTLESASNPTSAAEARARVDPDKNHRASRASAQAKDRQQPAAKGPRRHRIVEGDTLKRLAEKYLGSEDRYLSIFQANSDVLFDWRLIPIGVEIVIPDRATVVAQAAGAPTAGAAEGKPDAWMFDQLEDAPVSLPATVDDWWPR